MKIINISILIANYNGAKYLERCINSCINQTIKKNYEIIFIDDNSTDNSLDKIKKYRKKIKIIKTKKYKNISKFNTYYQLNTYYLGLQKAKGNIVCFLDSDDYFKKNKLSQIELKFSKDKKLNFIFDLPILVNSLGRIKNTKKKYGFRDEKWPLFPPQSCISVKKDIIYNNKIDLFQKKFHLTTLDFRIAALADRTRKQVTFLNKEMTYYYQHTKNETNKNFQKFGLNWFKRRKEAFKYYEIINKKKLISLDYFLTTTLVNFLQGIDFCKNKTKQYLSKIM